MAKLVRELGLIQPTPAESPSPNANDEAPQVNKRQIRLDEKIENLRTNFLPNMIYEAENRLKDHLDMINFKLSKRCKDTQKKMDILDKKMFDMIHNKSKIGSNQSFERDSQKQSEDEEKSEDKSLCNEEEEMQLMMKM